MAIATQVDATHTKFNSVSIGSANMDYLVPLTGFNYTVPNTVNMVVIEPAGTLSTGTINMPAQPIDGQRVTLSCTAIVTTLTMAGNGATLVGALAAFAASVPWTMVYRDTNNTWYRA